MFLRGLHIRFSLHAPPTQGSISNWHRLHLGNTSMLQLSPSLTSIWITNTRWAYSSMVVGHDSGNKPRHNHHSFSSKWASRVLQRGWDGGSKGRRWNGNKVLGLGRTNHRCELRRLIRWRVRGRWMMVEKLYWNGSELVSPSGCL